MKHKAQAVDLLPVHFQPGNEVKYTINLDWFECLLAGELVHYDKPLESYDYDGGKIRLILRPMGTKHFKHSYEVYIGGKIFGHINCSPRNTAIIERTTIQFQAANNVLYEFGFIPECRYLFEKLEWKIKNISRIDIALDTGGTAFFDLFKRWQSGEIMKLGKAQVQTFETGKKKLTGFDVGRRSSNKWITGYCKSDELEKSNKHYIGDMWKRAGLKMPGDRVERLELKLRNEELKRIKWFDWTELNNLEYLASIMRTSFLKFFDFVETGTDSNTSRKKKIDFIEWDCIGGAELDRLSTQQTTEIYRMKLSCKTLFGVYVATGSPLYADMAQEMAMNINCLKWYIDRLDRWRNFFEKKFGNNRDGEVIYNYMSNFRRAESHEQLSLFTIKSPQVSMFEDENF